MSIEIGLTINWITTALAKVCEINYGQSPPSSSYNREANGLPFFQGKSEFGVVYPLVEKWCNQPKRIAEKDDILISIRAPIGPTNLASEKCAIGRGLAAIRPKIDKSYVHFYIKFTENLLASKGNGTTFKAITKTVLDNHKIVIAPLNEQKRIVDKIERLFSDLDRGEALLKQVQKQLGTYRQSVLKAAVTGEIVSNEDSTWRDVKVGELLTDIRYGTAKKCSFNPEKTPVLRIPNVAGGKIDLEDLKHTDFTENELQKLSLEEGDILIVRSNGSASLVGLSAVVTANAVGFAYAGYLIRLRLNQDMVLPEFLDLVLHAPVLRRRLESQARSTSGVHNINSDEIKSIELRLPPLYQQRRIVDKVSKLLSEILVLESWCETELKRSATLRQSILKAAFSGHLVPQDPDDEPASVLLERIAKERNSKTITKEKKAPSSKRGRKPKTAITA